jgi:hypothetical protein
MDRITEAVADLTDGKLDALTALVDNCPQFALDVLA